MTVPLEQTCSSGCRVFELLSFQNKTDRINILKFSIDAYIAYISFVQMTHRMSSVFDFSVE